MRLYYLRHGQAEARAPSDSERALTPHGREEVARVARWLARQPAPVVVLVSPYRRAQETAAIVLGALPWATQPRTEPRLTPDEFPAGVLALLDTLAAPVVLLVGHQPLASATVELAVDGRPGTGTAPLPTAGLAVLEADIWAPGTARLLQLVTPHNVASLP